MPVASTSLNPTCTVRPPLFAPVSARCVFKAHSHARLPQRPRESALFQADACAWLGHWYKDINQNWFKARNCYKRALALQPDSIMIGARFSIIPSLCELDRQCNGLIFGCLMLPQDVCILWCQLGRALDT